MHATLITSSDKKANSRQVQTNRQIRSSSFLLIFAIVGSHIVSRDYGPVFWGLLALQFFVYPQLVYWLARRADDPMRTELGNLLIDPFLLGLWSAVLGYPVWITFALLSCTLVNNYFFRNTRGAVDALVAFLAGGLLWVAFMGLRFDPDTGVTTTVLCMAGLTIYMMLAYQIAFVRNLKLRDARERLLGSEQALQTANAALLKQLDEIQRLQEQLRDQANRDPLTDLYNRRYFDSTLERELARCKREGLPLCLMLIDVDHFKQVNDTYGHPAGDEVLKNLADMLRQQARAADVVCRYGGEEFLLLLPNMVTEVALARAEQWRAAFAQQDIVFGELHMRVTLSVGLAVYPGHGTTAQALVHCADQALYRAKAEGRNRVVIFDPDYRSDAPRHA